MNSPLSKINVGRIGKIVSFTDDFMAGRLMSMGILPGSTVKLIRRAPLQGGLYIKIDGFNIVLREREAANIVLNLNDR